MRITHTKFLYKINAIITNDVIRKTVLLNIVCLTGIAFLLPMGLLASLQHNYYLWITDWVLAFFLAGNLFYLRISGNLNHVVWINISLMMVFFFYLLSSGGVNNTAFVWYYVFPLFSISLSMVKEKAMKHGLRLSLNIEGAPGSFLGDERKLKQVVYNLLSNAVKFTPDGGQVEGGSAIRNGNGRPGSSANGKNLAVWVKDTGIGIEQRDLERLFAPFEQVETSTSRKFQGTGLGLALTKKIVELPGGRIQVRSEGKNKGSIFEFTLPIRQTS